MANNQWGPYFPQSQFEYGGQPTTPATPAQSPSGSVTGQSAAWNYSTGDTSTNEFLQNVALVEGAQEGSPALTSPVTIQGLSPVAISQNNWQSSCTAPVLS
jgi:hypothetical protein